MSRTVSPLRTAASAASAGLSQPLHSSQVVISLTVTPSTFLIGPNGLEQVFFGKEKLERVLDWVLELKIPWFTVYALSTENLSRPQNELDVLFDLYVEGLKDIADDERIHEHKVRVNIIGRRELLPQRLNDAIDYAESKTAEYDAFVFTVCLAYGSREEMITAIQSIAADHAAGDLSLEDPFQLLFANAVAQAGGNVASPRKPSVAVHDDGG